MKGEPTMTNTNKTEEAVDPKLDKVSTGGHLGGTHFGQAAGDAKTKEDRRDGGRKSRPNDGNN